MILLPKKEGLIKESEEFIFSAIASKDMVIDYGKGCYLWDVKGNQYLDLDAGLYCSILGHSNEEFNKAIIEQTRKVVHLGSNFLSLSVLEAVRQIATITPDELKKVILLCTGSEAAECALKIAKVSTGKYEIVGMERGYYGITQDAQSASGFGAYYGMSTPRAPGSHKILAPYCFRCPVRETYPQCDFLCLEVSKKLLDSNTTGNVAAFIFEPILGSGGIIVPPEGYFKRLKELADEYNALLIDDEVTTGIGRTGEWFGIQHYGIVPDILFASKTLGAGFPVAAVVTTPGIEKRCQSKKMIHVQSHMFDPLPAAAAEATISIVKKKRLVEHSKREGRYFLKRLEELKEEYDLIGDVRGKGLMIGVEIVNPTSGKPDPEVGVKLEMELLKKGLIVSFSSLTSVFRILPSLIIERQEIDYAMQVLEDSLRKVKV